jgi:hypothetical protein
MGEPNDSKVTKYAAKVAKKAAKAQIKASRLDQPETLATKRDSDTTTRSALPSSPQGSTPAERSAAAVEKQVRLQRLRVLIATLALLVALATLLLLAMCATRSPRPEASPGQPVGQSAETPLTSNPD